MNMDSDHVLVLFLGLLLVGAAVALAYTSPAAFGGDSEGIGGATLASFEATDVYCGDPNTTSGSAVSQDISGGEALVLDRSLPVASNDTTVSASLEEFGPDRYLLEITSETPEQTPTETPTPETASPTATPVNGTGTQVNETATPAPNGTEGDGTDANATAANATATNEDERQQSGHRDGAHADADRDCTGVPPRGDVQRDGPHRTARQVHRRRHLRRRVRRRPLARRNDGGSYDTLPERPERRGTNETAAAVGSVRQAP